VSVRLAPDVTHDPVSARLIGDLLDRAGSTGDKGDASAARDQAANEGQSQAGCPSCNSQANFLEVVMGWHWLVLRWFVRSKPYKFK
jgi:hypothetical protein